MYPKVGERSKTDNCERSSHLSVNTNLRGGTFPCNGPNDLMKLLANPHGNTKMIYIHSPAGLMMVVENNRSFPQPTLDGSLKVTLFHTSQNSRNGNACVPWVSSLCIYNIYMTNNFGFNILAYQTCESVFQPMWYTWVICLAYVRSILHVPLFTTFNVT